MKPRAFQQVDVFSATPYLGNPVAVVLDGSGLNDATMQRFARWTNLSDTTFVLPPTDPAADYRLRIFSPNAELLFAGQPTLGSCHAWLATGGQPKLRDTVVQQCEAGLVQIRRTQGELAFAAPPMVRTAPAPELLAQVLVALRLSSHRLRASAQLDNGLVWQALLLDHPDTVTQLAPDHEALRELGVKVGVAATGPNAFGTDLVVRAFAAHTGIIEDPATGGLNASLAQWLMGDGRLPSRYTAAQGSALGRAGLLRLVRDPAGQVWVGGHCVSAITGQVNL